MAISDLSDIVAAAKIEASFTKNSITTVAGAYYSLFGVAGMPGAASAPSTLNGDTPTDATAGALKTFTNPTAPIETYLGNIIASASTLGTLFIYDRLWQNVINVTSTSAQNITSGNFPRSVDWTDVELWLSIFAATGAGANAPTIQYTDEAGNTAAAGAVQGYAASAAIHRQYPVSLAAGDKGAKAMSQATNSVSMTSGTVGYVARRRIAAVPLAGVGVATMFDRIQSGMIEIPDDACIELLIMANTTSMALTGLVELLQG